MTLTYVEISTGHLTPDTLELLETQTGADRFELFWPAMTVAPYEYGLFMTVPDIDVYSDQMNQLPSDLKAVLTWAFDRGATVLRVDADAEAVHGLEYFE